MFKNLGDNLEQITKDSQSETTELVPRTHLVKYVVCLLFL